MRLKYYLRGAGIGIIITTLVLSLAFWSTSYSEKKKELTDQEIIERAEKLGMVMAEDTLADKEETAGDTDLEEASSGDNQDSRADDISENKNAIRDEGLDTDASDIDNQSEDTVVSYTAFTISAGQSSDTVTENLYEAGFIASAKDFNAYLIKLGLANRIQAGTFYISSDSSEDDIAAMLVMNQRTRVENGLTDSHQE